MSVEEPKMQIQYDPKYVKEASNPYFEHTEKILALSEVELKNLKKSMHDLIDMEVTPKNYSKIINTIDAFLINEISVRSEYNTLASICLSGRNNTSKC